MKTARHTRIGRTIAALILAFGLAVSVAACTNNPTIPGWRCTGYHQYKVPAHATLWGVVVHQVHYTPHNAANTQDIVRKVQIKYGYLGGLHAGQWIRIPWGCVKS